MEVECYRSGDEGRNVGIVVLSHSPSHVRIAGEIEILHENSSRTFWNLQSDLSELELHVGLFRRSDDEAFEDDLLVRNLFFHLSVQIRETKSFKCRDGGFGGREEGKGLGEVLEELKEVAGKFKKAERYLTFFFLGRVE